MPPQNSDALFRRFSKIVANFLLGLLILIPFSPSQAFSKETVQEEIPAVLDFDRRNSESYRFEFSPYGGDYFGDKLGHSFVAGGNFKWNLTEALGINTNFAYSRVIVDPTSDFGKTFTNNNEYIIDGGFVLSTPAAYRSKHKVVETDFFTSMGGGVLRINSANHPAGYIGGGMKIRLPIQWLAIRFEVRNYFTSVNNPSGSDFEDVLTIRVGPTFLIPPVFP